MARINLLPWRDVLRKEKQREFYTLIALSCLLMLVLLGYIHIHMSTLIDGQNARNDFMTQQIALVDKEITEIENIDSDKKKLLARMEVIQKLQASRPDIVRLFDEVTRRVPEGVYLTDLARTEDKLRIEGMAQSNARVATLIRNLEASDWFKGQKLVIIKADKAPAVGDGKNNVEAYKFTLETEQVLSVQTEKDAAAKEGKR